MMKANYVEFSTKLPIKRAGGIFQHAVRKRPLAMRFIPYEFFTPTHNDPFEALDDGAMPDFEVGASLNIPGPDPAAGTVILSCLSGNNETHIILRSTGNMRGRSFTNRLMSHVLKRFCEEDPTIKPTERSEKY